MIRRGARRDLPFAIDDVRWHSPEALLGALGNHDLRRIGRLPPSDIEVVAETVLLVVTCADLRARLPQPGTIIVSARFAIPEIVLTDPVAIRTVPAPVLAADLAGRARTGHWAGAPRDILAAQVSFPISGALFEASAHARLRLAAVGRALRQP